MIEQSIIPQGYVPSLECWNWLHSEHQRVLQLQREAYNKLELAVKNNGDYKSCSKNCSVLAEFEDIVWKALCECWEAQRRATDKLLAEGKALLAELAAAPDYSGYTGIPF